MVKAMTEIPQPPPAPPLMELLTAWFTLAKELKSLKVKEILTRKKIYADTFPGQIEGTQSVDLPDDYVLKGVLPYTREVDQAAMENGKEDMRKAGINPDDVFKYKPSLVKAKYNQLSDDQRALVDGYLTIKPGTPTLSIELPANTVEDADKVVQK